MVSTPRRLVASASPSVCLPRSKWGSYSCDALVMVLLPMGCLLFVVLLFDMVVLLFDMVVLLFDMTACL